MSCTWLRYCFMVTLKAREGKQMPHNVGTIGLNQTLQCCSNSCNNFWINCTLYSDIISAPAFLLSKSFFQEINYRLWLIWGIGTVGFQVTLKWGEGKRDAFSGSMLKSRWIWHNKAYCVGWWYEESPYERGVKAPGYIPHVTLKEN